MHMKFQVLFPCNLRKISQSLLSVAFKIDTFFVSCVSLTHAFASVHCCLVVTCWERADLLALVGDVYCIFITFPCGILGQVWYLIVSFPDLCHLSYFKWQRRL